MLRSEIMVSPSCFLSGQENLNLSVFRSAIIKKSIFIRLFEVRVLVPRSFLSFFAEQRKAKSTPVF